MLCIYHESFNNVGGFHFISFHIPTGEHPFIAFGPFISLVFIAPWGIISRSRGVRGSLSSVSFERGCECYPSHCHRLQHCHCCHHAVCLLLHLKEGVSDIECYLSRRCQLQCHRHHHQLQHHHHHHQLQHRHHCHQLQHHRRCHHTVCLLLCLKEGVSVTWVIIRDLKSSW